MDARFAIVGRRTVRIGTATAMPSRPVSKSRPAPVPEPLRRLAARRRGGRAVAASLLWLSAFAVALWPHWRWAAARLADGSDDPLGIAALAVLVACIVRFAPRLRHEPAPGWLAIAVLLVGAATVLSSCAPELIAALVAALALAAAIAAFAPTGTPIAPLAGLAALALPVVSSLQFYAGYPLRVVTAEASTAVLGLFGFVASRQGSAMQVDGHLVIVDAPCSGVQMVWMAYFCACAVAAWRGLPDRVFVRRLAFVGGIVLVANIARNSMLVGLEARGATAGPWLHDAIGLVLLGLVCAAVIAVMARAAAAPTAGAAWASLLGRRAAFAQGAARPHVFPADGVPLRGRMAAALVAMLLACALLPMAASATATAHLDGGGSEAPREWRGRPLRPLALDAVEARFAAHFPGRIERLTDDISVLVWREVRTPTRMLHPATDCYRGLGYRIEEARLERDAEAKLWRCFVARRDGRAVRVCERIEDAAGTAFTDASSWFWAAALGNSTGPWQALTVATPLGSAT